MKSGMVAGVIGASSESVYAIEEAKKRGIKVTAIDGACDAPGLIYADEGHVIDIRDTDAVFNFFDSNRIDFLLPVPVGRILTASGMVNERYNLPGVRREGANLSTDKWEFHKTLSEAGLRDAEAILVDSLNMAKRVSEMRFPIVFKPRFGSGSRDVKVYSNFSHFINELESFPFKKEDFIAETCKTGTEYGVDAIMIGGEYRMILLREKMLTPPPYRQCVGYYALEKTHINESLFNAIDKLLSESIVLLEIDDCLLHADIMYDGSKPFLIEISPRPSGHYLHNYFTRYACGFDMLGTYIDYACSKTIGAPYKLEYTYQAKSMLIRYFNLAEGVVEKLPSPEEVEQIQGVICYNNQMKVGDKVGRVTDGKSIMGRGFYVAEAPTMAECKTICAEVENKIVIREA